MEENTKKNDWFATLLYNPDLSLAELEQLNIVPDNSALLKREDYKNIPEVKEAFSDQNGNFKESEFNGFYDGALALYNKYANGEYEKKIPILHEYLDSKWDRPLEQRVADTNPTFDLKDNALRDPYKTYILTPNEDIESKTPKEIAESQEVVDYRTGESLGWTPEDKGGLFKGLVRPSIVLATWDEDGIHIENGREVEHKVGDLKFNEKGLPYPELLGDRELRTKQLIGYADTITREGSGWNKVDFFDSDDYNKSFVGTLAKTAVKTIPYFIPGVGEVFGAITAAEGLLRVLPILGKMVNGMATGDADNEFGKTMNKFEGWMARFDPTVSQHSQENLVTFENFGNLISSVSGQLFQQRMVGSIPYLLNGKQATEASKKLGRSMALAYMAATSSQDAYDTFKDAGASDRVAGFATLANMLALWKLMNIDYFRDNLFKGRWYMDESEVRLPAMNVAKDIQKKLTENGAAIIAEGEQALTKKSSLNFLNKLTDFYTNTMVAGLQKGGMPARMLSEGIEETMEEVTADLIKASTHVLNALGVKVTENNGELDFGVTPEEIAKRYGMAFFGGFIGGGIFAGQEKLEKARLRKTIGDMDVDDMKKFIYYIAEGRGQEMKDLYGKWHKRGLLGSKDLSTNLTTITSIDGKTPIVESASDNNLSQNDVVYRHLLNTIDFLEELVNSEAIGFTKQQIDNLKTIGFTPTDKTIRAQTLIDLGAYSTLQDELLNLAVDIVKKNNQIQEKLDAIGTPGDTSPSKEEYDKKIKNNKEIQQLQDELKELRNKRESILNGDLNYKYALQSLFITNPQLSSRVTGDLSKEAFTKAKYNLLYSALTDEQKSKVDEEYDEFKATTGKDRLLRGADLYYAMTTRWGDRIAELGKKVKGLSVDSFHKALNLGAEMYAKTAEKITNVEKQIADLGAKENLTDEERDQLVNLNTELTSLQNQISKFNESPWRALSASADENSEFKDINEKLLLGNLDDSELVTLGQRITAMYNKIAEDKKVLAGDFELQAFYNEIRNKYAGVEAKFNEYLDILNSRIIAASQAKGEDDVSYEVERWQDQLNGDSQSDQWITDELGEQSDIHDDVKDELQTFIDNFGINNQVATQALKNIKNILRTRTKLSDEQIQEFFDVVLPKYGIDNITSFMSNIDSIRSKITYSPILELLKEFYFDYSGTKTKVLDLIETEEKKLANSESLADYEIDNEQTKNDFSTIKSILDIIGAIILGATDKTNATINAFKKNPKHLVELENKVGVIFGNDIDVIQGRLGYLTAISDMNHQRALKIHERIDKNMRSKIIKTLISPVFVASFEKVYKYKVGDIERGINLKEIWDRIAPVSFDLDSINLMDPKKLQELWTAFEQEIYNEMQKVEFINDVDKMSDTLLSLFGDDIWQMASTKLTDDPTEIIQPIEILKELASIISLPSNAFYTAYKNATTKPSFKFAPVFGQEYAVRLVTSAMANSKLWNTLLDKLFARATKNVFSKVTGEDADRRRRYLENLSKLKNFFMIPGGAGTGKSTGIAGTIAAMFEGHKSKQFIALAPKRKQAEKLKGYLGNEAQYMTSDQFFKALHGGDPTEYVLNDNSHVVRSTPAKFASNIFDSSKELKILVIDEVGLYTEPELKEISTWAVANGVFVIGLGDPKQNSSSINVKETYTENGETKQRSIKYVSGLEDCYYFQSPMLTTSLRNANLAKKYNFDVMDSALFKIWTFWAEHKDWAIEQIDDLVPSTISMKYYEDSTKFFGEKLVKDDTDLIEEAKKFATKYPGKEIGIIYDPSSVTKYDNVKEDLKKSNIQLIPYDDMQGDELDYIFVDVDFLKHSKASRNSSKYLMLKNLYTVSQRSRIGSVIKKDNINAINGFKIVDNETSDPKLNQEFTISEPQIESFKEYRKNAMQDIPKDPSFFTFFKSNASTKGGTSAQGKDDKKGGKNIFDDTEQGGEGNEGGNGEEGNGSTPGTVAINMTEFHNFMANSRFDTYDKNEHSISSKISKSFANPENSALYKRTVNTIASYVRKNKLATLSNGLYGELERTFGRDNAEKLKGFLSQRWQLYIVPHDSNLKMVVARFGEGDDYIEVPITFVKTALVGRYKGGLKREKSIKVKLDNEHWSYISDFLKANPGVYVFNEAGVVVYDPYDPTSVENDSNIHNGSKNFLLGYPDSDGKRHGGNNGKTFILLTDELSDLDEYTDVWSQPGDGNLISHYNEVQVVGIHKPLSLKEIVAFVNAMQQGKSNNVIDPTKLAEEGLWEDSSNPMEVIKAMDWTAAFGSPGYYAEIYSRKWQVLPLDRALQLSKMLAQLATENKEYELILENVGLFLNTFVSNTRTQETHIIELSDGDKTIYITPIWENESVTGYTIYDGVIGEDGITFDYRGAKFPYKNLCDEYFNSNFVNINFKRYVKRNGEDHFSLIDITPNDQLYLLTEGLGKKENLLDRLNSELLNTQEFLNSIYMDDNAESDGKTRLSGSKYFAKLNSDFMNGGYVLSPTSVEHSIYSIDESKIVAETNSGRGSGSGGSGTTENPEVTKAKVGLRNLEKYMKDNKMSGFVMPSDDEIRMGVTSSNAWEYLKLIGENINKKQKLSKNSYWVPQLIFTDDVKIKIEHVDKSKEWIQKLVLERNLGNFVEILHDSSDNCIDGEFIAFSTVESGVQSIYKVVWQNKTANIVKFGSYSLYDKLTDMYVEDNSIPKMEEYIWDDLGGEKSNPKAEIEAFAWFKANPTHPFTKLVNDYLIDKLSKNEC